MESIIWMQYVKCVMSTPDTSGIAVEHWWYYRHSPVRLLGIDIDCWMGEGSEANVMQLGKLLEW